jgi:hypothetical protein
MIEPESTWGTTLTNLKPVSNATWAKAFADAVDSLTTAKMELTNIKTVPAQFTFAKAVFETQLKVLKPTKSAQEGANNFANAWATTVQSSIMVVTPGATIGLPPSPANTYSAVTGTLLDPASLAAAKAGLVSDILKVKPDPKNANAFARAFRKAFLALTYTTTGLNSVSPTPAPLIDAADPTI